MKKQGFTSIVNKKARHEYEVVETMEAGVMLSGPETKSVRLGQVSLRESFVTVQKNEVFLTNTHISPYKFAENSEYEPDRRRKLLLRRAEIERLKGKLQQKGLTAVPLKIFQKHKKFKVEIGVVRGKKIHEKREVLKRRDLEREAQRTLKDLRG